MAGQRNSHGKRPHSQSDYNDNGRNKRRNNSDSDRGLNSIGSDDTVYRYLCPSKKMGSIMGRGGEIVKQLRAETKAKIRIGETVSGCDERVVTIHNTSDESNDFDGSDDRVCPSMDALFKVHDRVIVEDQPVDEDAMDTMQITVRLLVPADLIGCCIGKGGQVIQNIRTDTGAQIRIMKDNHMPACALASDELVQITGEASNVRKALFQVAARLHDNPSRSQHLLSSSTPNAFPSSGSFMGTAPGGPLMGLTSLVGGLGAYGGYKGEGGEWPPRSYYPGPRDESSPKEFSLRLICPTANLGSRGSSSSKHSMVKRRFEIFSERYGGDMQVTIDEDKKTREKMMRMFDRINCSIHEKQMKIQSIEPLDKIHVIQTSYMQQLRESIDEEMKLLQNLENMMETLDNMIQQNENWISDELPSLET